MSLVSWNREIEGGINMESARIVFWTWLWIEIICTVLELITYRTVTGRAAVSPTTDHHSVLHRGLSFRECNLTVLSELVAHGTR